MTYEIKRLTAVACDSGKILWMVDEKDLCPISEEDIYCEYDGGDNIFNIKAFGKHTRAELVVMEELLDKYHKLYGQEKFTHQENN